MENAPVVKEDVVYLEQMLRIAKDNCCEGGMRKICFGAAILITAVQENVDADVY